MITIIRAALRMIGLGRPDPEYVRILNELRQTPNSTSPITREDLLRSLRALATRDPRTKEDLMRLEAESFLLRERIRKSPTCGDTPHFVWHFLDDADIRFKDPEYKVGQWQTLQECITAWEAKCVTQPSAPADGREQPTRG